MSNAATVHTGLWTNHQLSSAQGATLTLTTTNAAYLVAFLALFLGFVAGHFWAIVSYAVFQIRSTLAPRNGQHHQQQAILRNYHAPGAAIWQLFQLSWTTRQRRGAVAFASALPVTVLALVSLMAFGAAGILSAKVTSKESDVLIKSSECGFWDNRTGIAVPGNYSQRKSFQANVVEDFNLASTMATACQQNSTVASDCISYAPKQLTWTTRTNESCPFDKKICYQNTTVRFDSGLLDSTEHFGINAVSSDRIQLRAVMTCTPLMREGYVSDWHDMNGTRFAPGQLPGDVMHTAPGELWLEWFYGPTARMDTNSTIIYSDREGTVSMFGTQLYSLAANEYIVGSWGRTQPSWIPIPELNRTDADIELLFLRQVNGMQYAEPVTDPWFESTVPITSEYMDQPGQYKNVTVFGSEYPINAVGCARQFQWCDTSTGSNPTCTELTGLQPAITQSRKIFKSTKQRVTLERLIYILNWGMGFEAIVGAMAGNVLLMNKYGNYRTASPRPDQWIQELSHMFGTLLTNWQIRNYRYTGGYQSSIDIEPIIGAPFANETWMCDAQLVRREDYQSLSVLGLALICAIGGLIVIINLSLDSIVGWYQKKYKTREHATAEWEMLQAEALQRQLYKSHGVDLREADASMANVLERMKEWRVGDTMATLVEKKWTLKSVSSDATLKNKGSVVGVDVRRVDSDRTSPVSPLARSEFV
ncbi:hypothetical protein HBI56_057610 [Parastagonospora nodorum]|nr:hypothetical protein HBH53_150590 [Parastagonospora nodorum]KAH3967063.1 hypothetical protein HBH51_142010 [Parastagonospora nodorum]KAH4002817.1 hypothetical protein HBI10_070590 [Parastagonospora nodorum]KAH4027898.1 hypothetical protein HBI13_047430 [Parastagonospora nodorum]KAH4069957.1 hypothetical protein HBH50_092150 [Parastagonospora nodorum]